MADNSKTFKQLLVDILEEANEAGHNAESEFDRDLFADFLIKKGVCLCNVDIPAEAVGDSGLVSVTFPIHTPECTASENDVQLDEPVDEYDLTNLVRYISNRDYEHAIDTILKHEELPVSGGAGLITQVDKIRIRCDSEKASEFFAAIICGADNELDHYSDVDWHYTLKRIREECVEYYIPPSYQDKYSDADETPSDDFMAMIRDKLTLSRITFRALCVAVSLALLYFDNDDLREDMGLDSDFWNVLPKRTV